LDTEVGAFTLTGVDAIIAAAKKLETEVGTFVLAGIDANLDYSSAVTRRIMVIN
jgi:hypothetical protein